MYHTQCIIKRRSCQAERPLVLLLYCCYWFDIRPFQLLWRICHVVAYVRITYKIAIYTFMDFYLSSLHVKLAIKMIFSAMIGCLFVTHSNCVRMSTTGTLTNHRRGLRINAAISSTTSNIYRYHCTSCHSILNWHLSAYN